MNYKVRRNADGMKEVVVDMTGRTNSPLSVNEFCEIATREFLGIPISAMDKIATGFFKFEPERGNENQIVMSLNEENLMIYPVNVPESALRIWTTC